MTGTNLAIKENTSSDHSNSLDYLHILPNDYLSEHSLKNSSEYTIEELKEHNKKIQNLYDIINQTLDFNRYFLYEKSDTKELSIVDKLIETAIYLFPDYRNMTKDEIANEKKYELENFEVIDI